MKIVPLMLNQTKVCIIISLTIESKEWSSPWCIDKAAQHDESLGDFLF